jgi:catechol 2,3-dioxygenase-like lactoylglutathione lyase family enzyme
MTKPPTPQIDCDEQFPTLAVPNVREAVDFYVNKLGFTLGFTWEDPPTFAGVRLGSVSVHLSQGTPSPQGITISFLVGDADELYDFHRANGVSIAMPPADRPYHLRDYRVRDLHGYELVFGHHLMPMEPVLEIERVDVPVRLEKRLAAVLRDLAAYKNLSVNSCLEETLLHTFEPLGDGVASPHTRSQLRYIQELKKKHGIDYDSHGSYRFVEGSSP